MSTATATAPQTPPAGAPASPVEYVRTLTDEEKGDVFIALLRELIEVNGGGKGLIPIETPEGESLGYYVPPAAAATRADIYLPKLTPEEEVELDRRMNEPGIPMAEVIADFKARLAARETRPHESSGPEGQRAGGVDP